MSMTRSPSFSSAALIWRPFWARVYARRESPGIGTVRSRPPRSTTSLTSSPTPSSGRSRSPGERLSSGSRRAPLADLVTSEAAPDVARHDAPDAGDGGRRVLGRRQLVELFFARQQGADRGFELTSRGRLLSHFGSFKRRLAVVATPLTLLCFSCRIHTS